MTIDAGWNKIMKSSVPNAFQESLTVAQTPNTVFIDGQIKLMCSSQINNWSVFFRVQFLTAIEKAFATGADTVVLGFDNYVHVPEAKNMTQIKRSRHVPVLDFKNGDDLPPIMPENWSSAMRNRTFKVKVIQLIVNNIRAHYANDNGLVTQNKTVIVDFTDTPEVIGAPRDLPNLSGKRGECDIKAFSWMCYGPLLIVSTDGDFMAIALIQLEQMVLEKNCSQYVYLLRMKTSVDGGLKRPRQGAVKREYEYVDMLTILSWLNEQMQKTGLKGSPAKNFAALIASTGCDFAMNLPSIGPKTLWDNRNQFHNLDLTAPNNLFLALARVYHKMYEKKIRAVNGLQNNDHEFESIVHLYDEIVTRVKCSSKISNLVQSRTWNMGRMSAHVLNAYWTLLYWSELQHYPDPMSGHYGFERRGKFVTFGGDI
tara:strand:+ start:5338 stop:6615 length:1278 start_codon:yes stop_codon:yes gene_type:complete